MKDTPLIPGHNHLLCIDSDGCAVDSMNIKHISCFGPCLAEEWGLQDHKEVILKDWNQINLYSRTRGINRFLALGMELSKIDQDMQPIPGLQEYLAWVQNEEELSNASVERAFKESGAEIFRKALSWSEAVNRKIADLPKEKIRPFPNVREAMEKASLFGCRDRILRKRVCRQSRMGEIRASSVYRPVHDAEGRLQGTLHCQTPCMRIPEGSRADDRRLPGRPSGSPKERRAFLSDSDGKGSLLLAGIFTGHPSLLSCGNIRIPARTERDRCIFSESE